MSRTHTTLTPELAEYLRAVSVRETDVQRRLREETAQHPESGMQIMPEQAQLMALLAAAIGARRAVEVGVFTGYSSLAVALALPPDGKLTACDVNEEWTSVARQYWAEAGVAGKIDLRLGPALETLDGLLAEGHRGAYDLAFIDADKANYQNYYERILLLLRDGGLVLIDNVLWHGTVVEAAANDADTRAIRAFNAALHGDERVDLAMIPIGDGLTVARKRG